VSAALANDNIMMNIKPGEHGSTFGGFHLGMAVAKTAVECLIEEGMVENSRAMGNILEEEMLKIKSPLIADQRGKGLFRAIEFVKDAKIDGNDFAAELLRNGMITRVSHNYVVRMCPPLVIKDKQIRVAVGKLRKAVTYLENLSNERLGKK